MIRLEARNPRLRLIGDKSLAKDGFGVLVPGRPKSECGEYAAVEGAYHRLVALERERGAYLQPFTFKLILI